MTGNDSNDSSDSEESNQVENNPAIMRRRVLPQVRRHEGGGKEVVLLSLFGPYNQPVAKATIQTTDPNATVGGTTLGSGCYEVVVNFVMKRDALLLRPYGNINTMGDALGQSIAWPHQKMTNDQKATRSHQDPLGGSR